MNYNSLTILNVSRCKYKFERHVSNHCHNFYHMIYVTGGIGKLRIEQLEYQTQFNEVYLIPPWTNHEFYSNPSDPLCTTEVKFMVDDLMLEQSIVQLPHRMTIVTSEFRLMLDNILDEALNKRYLYKQLISTFFLALLFKLIRSQNEYFKIDKANNEFESTHDTVYRLVLTDGNDQLLNSIVHYLHQFYYRKITLQELSRHFAINISHLCRIFNKKYGVSPIQYLNHWRIMKAKDLLVNTELSITEISKRVGFQSVHYLSRSFRNKEEVSPLQFRNKHTESLYLTVEEKYTIVDAKAVK